MKDNVMIDASKSIFYNHTIYTYCNIFSDRYLHMYFIDGPPMKTFLCYQKNISNFFSKLK